MGCQDERAKNGWGEGGENRHRGRFTLLNGSLSRRHPSSSSSNHRRGKKARARGGSSGAASGSGMAKMGGGRNFPKLPGTLPEMQSLSCMQNAHLSNVILLCVGAQTLLPQPPSLAQSHAEAQATQGLRWLTRKLAERQPEV